MHRSHYKRLPVNRETYEPMDFGTIKTEEQAYVLGFLAADGHVSQQTNRIGIELAAKDQTHLWKLAYLLLGIPKPIHYKKPRAGGGPNASYFLGVSSARMAEQLLSWGLTQRKSLTLQPPKKLLRHLIRHWVRGYFDGDGSVMLSGTKYRYPKTKILGTKNVCSFINDQFLKVFSHNCHLSKQLKLTALHYGSKTGAAFLEWIYRDAKIFLDRKYVIAEPYLDGHLIASNATSSLPVQTSLELSTVINDKLSLWQPEEDALIQSLYMAKDPTPLRDALPHRPWKQIRNRANYLGLRKSNRKDRWSEQDTQQLLELHDHVRLVDICKTLQRPAHTVLRKLRALGLQRAA